MKYLSVQEIVIIHDEIIAATGGSLGLREPNLLESASSKPQASFGGEDLYPDLFIKAAVLYESLCNYHVFIDGNKRTSAISMYRFLNLNGYDLTATNNELEHYTHSIAVNKPDIADIAIWINEHSKALI